MLGKTPRHQGHTCHRVRLAISMLLMSNRLAEERKVAFRFENVSGLKFDSDFVVVRVRARNKSAAGEFSEPVALETKGKRWIRPLRCCFHHRLLLSSLQLWVRSANGSRRAEGSGQHGDLGAAGGQRSRPPTERKREQKQVKAFLMSGDQPGGR